MSFLGVVQQLSAELKSFNVCNRPPSCLQMWFLLPGGGPRPCRDLQRHPHHLPAQTGRTLLPGLGQHLPPQGLPAAIKSGRLGFGRKVLVGALWDVSESVVMQHEAQRA